MKSNISITLLLLICFFSFYPKVNSESFLNFNQKSNLSLENPQNNSENYLLLDNAIYVIRTKDSKENLDINKDIPLFVNNPKQGLKKHFRIISIDNKTKKQTMEIKSDNIYCIEDKDKHKRIGVINDNGEIGLLDKSKTEKNDEFINENFLWNITPKIIEGDKSKNVKKLYYYVKNVSTGKYLKYKKKDNKNILICDTQSILMIIILNF